MITVVGLGCDKNDLTVSGLNAVNKGKMVFLRTALTKAAKGLLAIREDAVSLDFLYEEAQTFDELIEKTVEFFKDKQNAVYCVDGNGSSDPTVKALSHAFNIRIIAGVSSADKANTLYCWDKYQTRSALDIVNDNIFFQPDVPLIVTEIDDKYMSGELKLKLLDAYGDIDCVLLNSTPAYIKLSDLDRQKKYGYYTTLLLPQIDYAEKSRFSFDDLIRIVFRLRAPDGCPWDIAQTHMSIRSCCLEEAYELVEAIELDDIDKMTEEAGDVTLQGVFHASIAEGTGEFTVSDMISGICSKLVHRHTHIFGKEKAKDGNEAHDLWEKAKAKEKGQLSATDKAEQVATTLPSLNLAIKYAKIALKEHPERTSGDFWKELLCKVYARYIENPNEENAGNLLFTLSGLVNALTENPEVILNAKVNKIKRNIKALDSQLKEEGESFAELEALQIIQKLLEE